MTLFLVMGLVGVMTVVNVSSRIPSLDLTAWFREEEQVGNHYGKQWKPLRACRTRSARDCRHPSRWEHSIARERRPLLAR